MIAACASHVPLHRLPARVHIVRHGHRVRPKGFLRAGDELRIGPRTVLRITIAGNRYRIGHGMSALACRRLAVGPRPGDVRTGMLAVSLTSGRVRVTAGARSRRAAVLTSEMLAFAPQGHTTFVVNRIARERATHAWTLDRRLVAARGPLRIDARRTYLALSDHRGLRLDIWPFAISRRQRATTPADHLPAYWADGLPCSVGCHAAGSQDGWPLKPFHRQHAIRAGINELRPANFHVGVDIQAHDGQPVYAIQSGVAHIRYADSADVNVDVGRFFYWHVVPRVADGQYVAAYRTEIGTVLGGEHHIALSEGTTDDYLNPLRPGGTLQPYRDREPPVIGAPRIFADGDATVATFDPQSFVGLGYPYETPVLAPSSLAWRLYSSRGRPLTPLLWAMRGSQNYPPALKPTIFAPGASNPGYLCFFRRRRCIPNWVYRLTGGLTEPLPLSRLRPGRYRLTVYAWDWAGNTSARDDWITLPLSRASVAPAAADFGPLDARPD